MHLWVAQYVLSVLQEQLVPIMLPSHQLFVNQDITHLCLEVLTVHYALRAMSVLSPTHYQLHVMKELMLWLDMQSVFFAPRVITVHQLIPVL